MDFQVEPLEYDNPVALREEDNSEKLSPEEISYNPKANVINFNNEEQEVESEIIKNELADVDTLDEVNKGTEATEVCTMELKFDSDINEIESCIDKEEFPSLSQLTVESYKEILNFEDSNM